MRPRRDQRQWLAQAAREENVEITAEGGGDLVLDLTLIADGYTAFEHGLPIELHKDVIEFAARSKTYYTPTLIVGYGGPTLEVYFNNKGNYHDDAKLRRFTPEDEVDRWRRYQHIPDDEWHFLTISKGAAAIAGAGGLVTMGAHGNRQGQGAHWEMWGLQMGGLTPLQAIRASTALAAEKIGLEKDLGVLGPGMVADFLVLTANPLVDIH